MGTSSPTTPAPESTRSANGGASTASEPSPLAVAAHVRDGRQRAVIEAVMPQVDGGRFAAKRVLGERVHVTCDAFTDGHDSVACLLRWRHEDDELWQEAPMTPLVNDTWEGGFDVDRIGRWYYTLSAWIDRWGTWHRDFGKRVQGGQADLDLDLRIGAGLVRESAAVARAAGAGGAGRASAAGSSTADADADVLERAAGVLERGGRQGRDMALDIDLDAAMRRWPDRSHDTELGIELPLVVDRERARYSSWYECFPRSCGPADAPADYHGTLADLEQELPRIADMGFNVLYLPPVHPIGTEHRKGPNNNVTAGPGDPGSPWAIGSAEGGHTALHPQLGTIDDFDRLLAAAEEQGLELAMDLAYQCAPDHPWVAEHPEWFRKRPDGSIQYAENPPKKYQDIFPIDFESSDWEGLWHGLKSVVDFWVERGVRIFRVDNPHTKAFSFWEWMIGEVKREHPDVIFLSEAFTRPKVMYRLAKAGFTQSYTYFTWRQSKWELEEYLREVTTSPVAEIFRPNLWPNTPDILTEQLQHGGRSTFVTRLVLAATLGASYGVYGPAFEHMEHLPAKPGSEEYLDSEKYQVRRWQHDRPGTLAELMAVVNRAPAAHPALQRNDGLRFHETTNESVMAYSKVDPTGHDIILVVANLDPQWKQSAFVDLPLAEWGIDVQHPFVVDDLIGRTQYLWQGERNFVELDPNILPVHVFHVRKRSRDESDFEYFL